jgi:hypothetical protein
MIQRFEDEYPETKIPALPPSTSPPKDASDLTSLGSSLADASVLSTEDDSTDLSKVVSPDELINGDDDKENLSVKLSRASSSTSLNAKALSNEEGRMHRFGQGLRREILRPSTNTKSPDGSSSATGNTTVDGSSRPDDEEYDASDLAELRERLENVEGKEIRDKLIDSPTSDSVNEVLQKLGIHAKELAALQKDDPETFERFKGAQMMAALNSGYTIDGVTDTERKS